MSSAQKDSNTSKFGEGGQTVTKSYVPPHKISARDMSIDEKGIYRDYREVAEAVKEGSFEVGKTSVWHKGRLYFLCLKEKK